MNDCKGELVGFAAYVTHLLLTLYPQSTELLWHACCVTFSQFVSSHAIFIVFSICRFKFCSIFCDFSSRVGMQDTQYIALACI